MKLDYIYHSGFAIEAEGVTLIIDYFQDSAQATSNDSEQAEYKSSVETISNGFAKTDYEGSPKTDYSLGIVHETLLQRPGKLYVLCTHFHPDHFNPEVLTWKEQRPDIRYIFSKDIVRHRRATKQDATYIKKGETYEDDTLRIDAFGSTDVGSSFLIHLQGMRIFHAGDLNNWHWSEESTPQEINKANGDFLAELELLRQQAPVIDLALFPVDRRMGKDYMKGAKQFIEQIKTTIFVPMHFSEDYEGGNAFQSIAQADGCRFISINHRGESFDITK